MKRILVSDNLLKEGLDILKSQDDFEIAIKTDLSPEELKEQISTYNAIIVRSGTTLNTDIIDKADNMEVIGRAGVGLDNIDIEAASKKGIIVMNAPGGNTISTAEHTMSLMLALSRNIPQACQSVKNERWERKKFIGSQLNGKVIGIIGLGRIGSEVAKRSAAFGMKVYAYDPFLSAEKAEELGVKLVELDDLLKKSDYITVHVPITDETKHMIDREELRKMKKNVRIINCARGGIINEEALEGAIKEDRVGGVALDVYETRPQKGNRLLRYDNVIGTPHLGASTEEAQKNVAIDISQQIVDALREKSLRNTVNVPSLDPETYKIMEPYIDLGEKIGLFQGQLLHGRFNKVVIKYSGDAANKNTAVMTIAVMKGLLTPVVGAENVNYVNASMIAQRRGIKVIETKTAQMEDYTNLITVQVSADNKEGTIMGTLFTRNAPRIVKIDKYKIESIPEGYLIYTSYKDVPGVLGRIGTILGENDINIAAMTCGRDRPRGKAVSILNVDSEVPKEVLSELKSENIYAIKLIEL